MILHGNVYLNKFIYYVDRCILYISGLLSNGLNVYNNGSGI